MRCICKQKTASLLISREAVLYDIGNYAYVEGDIMESGDDHTRHQVFDITQDGNIDRVNRILDLAYSECVEIMYPFTKVPICGHISTDDELESEADFIYTLNVPIDFSKTTAQYLTKLLHEFMVCRVLSDWLSITKPESRENWERKMKDIAGKIKSALNHRSGALRRKQSPF